MLGQQALDRISFDHDGPTLLPQPLSEFRIMQELMDSFGQFPVPTGSEQKTRSAVVDEFRDATDTASEIR